MNKKLWVFVLISLAAPLQGMCCCKRDKDKYRPNYTGFYFVQKKQNKPEERMRAFKQSQQTTACSRDTMWKKKSTFKKEERRQKELKDLEKVKQFVQDLEKVKQFLEY